MKATSLESLLRAERLDPGPALTEVLSTPVVLLQKIKPKPQLMERWGHTAIFNTAVRSAFKFVTVFLRANERENEFNLV